MDTLIESVVTIALAIVGVAMLAVLVSKNANTTSVISAGGGAFSESLLSAEAPVLSGANVPGLNAYY